MGDAQKGFSVQLTSILTILAGSLALLWSIEAIDSMLGGALDHYGILPRRVSGLVGIFAAPFLHGGYSHLSANSASFLVFGTMLLLRSRREFAIVTIVSTLLGGLGTWLFGSLLTPLAIHIGASGVIFGYFGYLVSMGLFERKIGSIALSIILSVLYGGMLMGLVPGQQGMSWESHLFGFLSGLITARFVARYSKKETKES